MPLAATSIVAGYRRATVLNDVSCAIEPGAVTAILGPNGAGKTTLLRVLLGALRPARGTVSIDDADLSSLSSPARARRIAFIPQATAPDSPYSALQIVRLGRISIAEPGASAEAAARRALAHVGLGDRGDAPLGSLSAGQQQRVLLARAMAQLDLRAEPGRGVGPPHRYLLADEPVASMDPRHALGSMESLRRIADSGVGVAIVLHDFALAARYADHCVLLDEGGRLAFAGPTREALDPPRLAAVFRVAFEMTTTSDGRPPVPLAVKATAPPPPSGRSS